MPINLYLIDERQLALLQALASRLYTETRLSGDDMRNAAQLLDVTVRVCKQVPVLEDER